MQRSKIESDYEGSRRIIPYTELTSIFITSTEKSVSMKWRETAAATVSITAVHTTNKRCSSIQHRFFRSFGRSRQLVVPLGHVISGLAARRSTATTSMASSHLAISGGDIESPEYAVRWFSVDENSTTQTSTSSAVNVISFWFYICIRR